MALHGITPPSRDYEEKNCPAGTVPVYLARGGELCALFTVQYNADPGILGAMAELVRRGCDLAVLTTDSNLSAAGVAQKFSLPEDAVTLVPEIVSLQNGDLQQEDLFHPPVTVRSRGAAMLRAVSCCIAAKASLQLAVLLQNVGTMLGLVLIFVFCAAGSIAQIGAVEMLAFECFWMTAVTAIPAIKRF